MELSENEELFLAYLENSPSVAAVAREMDISPSTAYKMYGKLKDVIIDRARANLSMGALKAASTAVEMMDADASTEKGELRLAAAEKVMDRVGLTKHTNVEVSVESENGLFILPAKVSLASSEDLEEDFQEE